MHLHFSPEDEAFRREIAALARARARRRVRRAARRRRPRQRERARRGAPRLGAPARAGRLDLHRLAARVGRPRRLALAAGDLPRGVRARARPRPPRPHRRGPARPHAAGLRHRRAEASLPARRSRAARRSGARATRSRTPAPTSRTCRRGPASRATQWVIDGQKVWTSWAQWADWCFVLCRSDPQAAEAQGALLPAGADAAAGDRGAPDPAAHGRLRVQRGLLRRRAHARPRTSSDGPATAGRSRWEPSPSSAAPRRSASTCSFRNELEQVIQIAQAQRQATAIRCCASAWPTPGSGSR